MITNNMCLPQPFVNAVKSNHRYTPKRYSVTDVLGGTCEAVLKRRHDSDITEDVSQRIWALFGTAVHKVLQEAEATESQLQENWLSVPIRGTSYELSGIFDLYDDETKTVTDWKTTGTIKWQKQEFDDYRLQTLIYCWMLRKKGYKAKRGEVVMILRDWSKPKARYEKDYPKCQVQKVGWDFLDDDFKEAEGHIKRWFEEVSEQEKRGDSELMPCSPEKRWHKDDKWAVVKDCVKRATRVLDNEADAISMSEALRERTGKPYHVEYRKGEDVKCEMYCSVSFACPFFQKQV